MCDLYFTKDLSMKYCVQQAKNGGCTQYLFGQLFMNELLFAAPRIKFRIAHIKVFAVEFFLNQTESFTETLEMNDFTLTQETDRFTDFRVFYET